jgi:hypothetical protein
VVQSKKVMSCDAFLHLFRTERTLVRVRTLKGKQENNKDEDKMQLEGKKAEKERKK